MCAKFIAPSSFGSRVCTVKHLSGNQYRLVILHYHLFKKKGSSVGKILTRNIMGHPAEMSRSMVTAQVISELSVWQSGTTLAPILSQQRLE